MRIDDSLQGSARRITFLLVAFVVMASFGIGFAAASTKSLMVEVAWS